LRDNLHRMQRPVMKSNRCPPACKSITIASLSLSSSYFFRNGPKRSAKAAACS
jgi:hypothetical protein